MLIYGDTGHLFTDLLVFSVCFECCVQAHWQGGEKRHCKAMRKGGGFCTFVLGPGGVGGWVCGKIQRQEVVRDRGTRKVGRTRKLSGQTQRWKLLWERFIGILFPVSVGDHVTVARIGLKMFLKSLEEGDVSSSSRLVKPAWTRVLSMSPFYHRCKLASGPCACCLLIERWQLQPQALPLRCRQKGEERERSSKEGRDGSSQSSVIESEWRLGQSCAAENFG